MICLGASSQEKVDMIAQYCADHHISKVVVFSPEAYALPLQDRWEAVEYSQIIQYVFYYRLLQEIGSDTLLVVNECLRNQNRHDLTYNCLRNYLNQTKHVIVFQHLPIIDAWDDFAILFDLATQSRWKRERITSDHLHHVRVVGCAQVPMFREVPVPTPNSIKTAYDKKKAELFAGIGLRDPHTLPRNLYLVGGKAKQPACHGRTCIGRNNRLGLGHATFDAGPWSPVPDTIVEFPHDFRDMADLLALTRARSFDVLVADLKVDRWYWDRYQSWVHRQSEACSLLGVTC